MRADAFGTRGSPKLRSQCRIIGIGHVDETVGTLFVEQRRHAGEIDVVGQQHEAAGSGFRLEASGSIGEEQRLATGRLQCAHRALHAIGAAMFIEMRPSLHHRHGDPGDGAEGQPAEMPGDTHGRKARQIAVRDDDRLLDRIGESAEAGAEHDADLRGEACCPGKDDLGGGSHSPQCSFT
jgi:hypothetical protein